MANNVAADKLTSYYFHAEAHALSGKLNKPFEEQIKEQALVKLVGHSRNLLLESESKEPQGKEFEELKKVRERKAERNYLSQHSKNFRLESIISYSAAHTQVSGHRSKKDPDDFVTLATSSVENLNVLNVVTADRVVAQISTTHRKDPYSPEVTFLGTHFENLRIARHKCEPYLKLDACKRVLRGNEMRVGHDPDFKTSMEAQYGRLKAGVKGFTDDDRKKMCFTADDSLIKTYHEGELDFADFANQATGAQKSDLDPKTGYSDWDGITCSLVEHVDIKSISAKDADGKNVEILLPGTAFGHVIHVRDFGTIFLAELRVNHNSYNLTMIRLELGCIADGNASVAACTVNGGHKP